ncbi:MAG: ACT domain-containing protein [Anaerolineae bacterium]|nr:ACT domain-containing protein [Anaerolineae bacterium]
MDKVSQALAEAALYTDGQEYTVIHLPLAAITAAAGVLAEIGEAFSVVIADKDEVTLILAREIWDDFKQARLPERQVAPEPFRLVTFDLPLTMDLVGFMAAVSGALAEAGVPLLAFSAYARDHLLVPAAQFDTAWAALKTLKALQSGA